MISQIKGEYKISKIYISQVKVNILIKKNPKLGNGINGL